MHECASEQSDFNVKYSIKNRQAEAPTCCQSCNVCASVAYSNYHSCIKLLYSYRSPAKNSKQLSPLQCTYMDSCTILLLSQTNQKYNFYTTRIVLCPLVVGTCTEVWLIGKQLQFKCTHTHTHHGIQPPFLKSTFSLFYKGGQPSCTKFSSRVFCADLAKSPAAL